VIEEHRAAVDMAREVRLFFRDQLRRARASALSDAEGFHRLIAVIERLGAYLKPDGHGLGD
jgi:hypothetical protein